MTSQFRRKGGGLIQVKEKKDRMANKARILSFPEKKKVTKHPKDHIKSQTRKFSLSHRKCSTFEQ